MDGKALRRAHFRKIVRIKRRGDRAMERLVKAGRDRSVSDAILFWAEAWDREWQRYLFECDTELCPVDPPGCVGPCKHGPRRVDPDAMLVLIVLNSPLDPEAKEESS